MIKTSQFKNVLIIILILSGIDLLSVAQENKSFIGLQSGISIPIGGYREQNLGDGSFALSGFTVAIEGAWFFSNNFGAGMSASLNMHPVEVSSLGRARMNADPFLSNIIIRSEPYRIITIMPGIFAQKDIGVNWAVSAKFLAGLLYGRTPYQLYKPDYYLLPNTWQEITAAHNMKFSWQAGLGIIYHISPCIGLTLNGDVLYDKLKFTFQTSTGTRVDEKTIAMINLALGFRIRL